MLPQASAGATFQTAWMQREVPRHDRGDDADRLAQGVGERTAARPGSSRRRSCRPSRRSSARHSAAAGDVDLARLEDRLAVVQRLQPRDLVGPLQRVGDLPQQRPRSRADIAAPGAVERGARRRDRRVDVRGARRGDLADHLFGRRVHGDERRPPSALHPLAVDQEPARAGASTRASVTCPRARRASPTSDALELRLPLGDVGVEPFLGVRALEELLLQLALDRERRSRTAPRRRTAPSA